MKESAITGATVDGGDPAIQLIALHTHTFGYHVILIFMKIYAR